MKPAVPLAMLPAIIASIMENYPSVAYWQPGTVPPARTTRGPRPDRDA